MTSKTRPGIAYSTYNITVYTTDYAKPLRVKMYRDTALIPFHLVCILCLVLFVTGIISVCTMHRDDVWTITEMVKSLVRKPC